MAPPAAAAARGSLQATMAPTAPSNPFHTLAPPAAGSAFGVARDQGNPAQNIAQPAAADPRDPFRSAVQPAVVGPVHAPASQAGQSKLVQIVPKSAASRTPAEQRSPSIPSRSQTDAAPDPAFDLGRQQQIAEETQARARAEARAVALQQQQIEAEVRARARREQIGTHYGSASLSTTGLASKTATRRGGAFALHIVSLVFVPWALFTLLSAVAIFARHSYYVLYISAPMLTLAIIMVVALAEFLRHKHRQREGLKTQSEQAAVAARSGEPRISHVLLLCILLLFALPAAYISGSINYHDLMFPWYSMQLLHTYSSIDPKDIGGQQVMDAGQVHFVNSTRLILQKSFGLKNSDFYCVAPIGSGDEPLASYDFWAVGLNCCTNAPGSFKCGEWSNDKAHAGLRLIAPERSDFYHLAMVAAQATFKIRSTHPLFFEWVEEPAGHVDAWRQKAQESYLLGLGVFLCLNFVLALAGMTFAWCGRK